MSDDRANILCSQSSIIKDGMAATEVVAFMQALLEKVPLPFRASAQVSVTGLFQMTASDDSKPALTVFIGVRYSRPETDEEYDKRQRGLAEERAKQAVIAGAGAA